MRASFHPFLPNGLTGDPVVRVELIDGGRSILLDLGDLRGISNRTLLRADRVVVSHTHVDHFFGFDQLLRLALTRERELVLTGPAGFIDNVRGRLAGYTWNLIASYPLRLRVEEIDGEQIRSVLLTGAGGLLPQPAADRGFDGTIHEEEAYRLDAVVLDHGVPVLGVALRESEHLAVNKDRLQALGLAPGAWLQALKSAIRCERPAQETIEAAAADGTARSYPLGELAAALLLRSPGQQIAYLTDLRCSASNLERAVALANGVQLLICEAAFLQRDERLARERNHLTARQAGELARAAGVERLAPFHVSARYEGREEELLEEAQRAFGGPVVRLPRGPANDAAERML